MRVRCGRCGNENSESNRFCGMCGASLVATAQAGERGTTQAPALVQPVPGQAPQGPLAGATLGSMPAERRPAPSSPSHSGQRMEPVITGPSFLGLNTSGPRVDRHVERDPLRTSSNLKYLLEEDEEPKRSGGKLLLIVVALALAVGFGYLHWRQGGFDWLNAGEKKPAAAGKETPDAAPSAAESGGAAGAAAATPDSATTPTTGASGGGAVPSTSGVASSPADSAATPAQTDSQATAAQTTPAQKTPAQAEQSDPNLPAGSTPAGFNSDGQSPAAEATARPKPETHKPAAVRPVAVKPTPAKPIDPVTEAERFIYARGARQDCDRGLRMLKVPAEQSNSKAMISLGALYSTGTCTPRDLPTAYRWFALALHKEPDNQALQDDLQRLWSQMTAPERQLAIKLSQ